MGKTMQFEEVSDKLLDDIPKANKYTILEHSNSQSNFIQILLGAKTRATPLDIIPFF